MFRERAFLNSLARRENGERDAFERIQGAGLISRYMCHAGHIARGLVVALCVSGAAGKKAGHLCLKHGELAPIRQEFNVATPAGFETEMTDHAVGMSEPFAARTASEEAAREQGFRAPRGSVEENERLDKRGVARAPIQDQAQHPTFVVEDRRRQMVVATGLREEVENALESGHVNDRCRGIRP